MLKIAVIKEESEDLEHYVDGILFQVVNQSFASYNSKLYTR